ncbi:MAG: aminomethyl-transferring glycine dehydrogenase subunit GcvPA [Actinomycetota bacterium]
MDFIPHTDADRAAMLESIGVASMDELFASIPTDVRFSGDLEVPQELNEVDLVDHVTRLAQRNRPLTCFAGGGTYEHHVPAVVRALASRGEFATSYTPYQPELSQGVLQAVYEFQTMVCELYGMDVANASLYDGASALVEAVNLAVRVTTRERIVLAGTIHPHHLAVLRTYTSGLGFDLAHLPVGEDGVTDWAAADVGDAAAVVCPYPNFFGRLEDLAAASARAHDAGALSVAMVDPTAMGVLKSPSELGADVAVGEGAMLGNAMSYGGPYVGFFATKLAHVRQVPGRIAGETLDADGRRAYVLTLQAREQHIRRAKATSNVCTNQTLMAIAATIHLGWLGPVGLRRMGEICIRRTAFAAQRLADIPGCRVRFAGPHFKEFVLETPAAGADLVAALGRRGFLCGPHLGRWFPELDRCLLIAVTERRTRDDITALAEAIEKELTER